jgi:hypothetical protein
MFRFIQNVPFHPKTFRSKTGLELSSAATLDSFFGTKMLPGLLPSTLGPDSRHQFFHCGSPDAMTSLAFSSIQTKSYSDLTTLKKGFLYLVLIILNANYL